jgi:hypothetical protein
MAAPPSERRGQIQKGFILVCLVEKKIKKKLYEWICISHPMLPNYGGYTIKRSKALFLTLWINSFLIWLYIVARIVVNNVPLGSLFIDSIPFFTFTILGIVAFVLSMVFMFLYLWER